MGYILNEQSQKLVELARNFMETEVMPHIVEWDREGTFPMEAYQKAFSLGFHKMELPKENGGLGMDYVTVSAVLEEIGKYDAGFATSMMSCSLAMKPILLFGDEAQKQRACDLIVPGGFAGFCLTEPETGTDVGALTATAIKDGDDYIINAHKRFCTSGKYASVYTVFANAHPELGAKGLCAFMVEAGLPGMTIGKEEDKMGIRTSSVCDVIFEDVRVPASSLLSGEGMGFKIAMETLNLARPLVGAVAVGIAQRAVDLSAKYANERVSFGKPIGKFQGVSFKIADMEIGTETARQMVAHTFTLKELHLPYTKEAAIAKCYAGDVAMKNAVEAVQIFGGYGFCRDYPVEKLMRDAKIFQIFEGTGEAQRITVAGQVMKKA